MRNLFVFILVLLCPTKSIAVKGDEVMDALYGKELDEFVNTSPRYTPEELRKYVVNSIKFILNAAPDITAPLRDNHPWKTPIFNSQGYEGRKVVVPLLDSNLKPLFVTSSNNEVVPNFDMVELKPVTGFADKFQGFRYLRPQRTLHPIRRATSTSDSPYRSWVHPTEHTFSEPEQDFFFEQVPKEGVNRGRFNRPIVHDQIAHSSFSYPELQGLRLPDVYSPDYTETGPRRLVTFNSMVKKRLPREWDKFLGLKYQSNVIEAGPATFEPGERDMLSRFGTDIDSNHGPDYGSPHNDLDLGLHL